MAKKLPITTPNKDITVSWMYTWARQQEMSIHEQRIVIRMLEFCQDELKGLKLRDHLCKLEHGKYDVKIEMPAAHAIFDSNLNADTITDTLENLAKRFFKYEDDKRWWMCSFITSPEYIKGTGIMKFSVDNKIWDIWLNLSKGYRRFELNKALALPTTYAVQFYMLMSGSEKPISFTVEQFKDWLGIAPEAYKKADGKDRIDHLEERVIRPSQKYLDESCPYTFTYTKIKQRPDLKRSRVIGFTFTPKYQPKFRDEVLEGKRLQAQVCAAFSIRRDIYDYLIQQCGFTAVELNNTKEIWHQAQELLSDPLGQIAILKGRAREAQKTPKAYIVGAMKNIIADAQKKKK